MCSLRNDKRRTKESPEADGQVKLKSGETGEQKKNKEDVFAQKKRKNETAKGVTRN